MRKWLSALALFFMTAGAADGQKIIAYSADDLVKRTSGKDTLYIINFWATWCAPCVKELPAFDTLQQKYRGRPVKVILVSFDFRESYPQKIAGFIKKKSVLPEVVWFNETNANVFIPKINDAWSGALPATMIVQSAKSFKTFMERPVTAGEISAIVDKQLAP